MNKPSIIICDIDGVLANEQQRRDKFLNKTPKDYEGYYSDVSRDTNINLLWDILNRRKVAFFTGRRESCRKQTLQWLDRRPFLKVDPKLLFMRSDDDKRHAVILKEEYLLELQKEYEVMFAIDDNKSICRMYNSYGIPTLHCKFYDLENDN